jgi:hypothetical protein
MTLTPKLERLFRLGPYHWGPREHVPKRVWRRLGAVTGTADLAAIAKYSGYGACAASAARRIPGDATAVLADLARHAWTDAGREAACARLRHDQSYWKRCRCLRCRAARVPHVWQEGTCQRCGERCAHEFPVDSFKCVLCGHRFAMCSLPGTHLMGGGVHGMECRLCGWMDPEDEARAITWSYI